MQIKISILIPVFNEQNTIQEILAKVLAKKNIIKK